MASDMPLYTTQVLAIASHVSYGYVGNKMATFVMQALGCDVSAIDTVHFSNHTAYKQWKGRRVPAEEIEELYEGLKQSDINDFDMMLSGYAASKEVVEMIGKIGRDQKYRTSTKPGSFFWILDPVMGDQGHLYVAEDIVPAYRALLPHADLILPNAFEAELLAESKITDRKTLVEAITSLHRKYQVPHIIVTSVSLPEKAGAQDSNEDTEQRLLVVGSSMRTDHTPRIFSVEVPKLPIFFSGTGDMFAALILCRLREAVSTFDTASETSPDKTDSPPLMAMRSWIPPDSVPATALPLAKATEKTLASMQHILAKTAERRKELLVEAHVSEERDDDQTVEKKAHLKRTKASEVRVVNHIEDLRHPQLGFDGLKFEAREVVEDIKDTK